MKALFLTLITAALLIGCGGKQSAPAETAPEAEVVAVDTVAAVAPDSVAVAADTTVAN